jgi:hypothetical protein
VRTAANRPRWILTWAVANLVMAYLASFVLLLLTLHIYHAVAEIWGTVSSPIDEGEASPGLVIILTVPMTAVAVLVNRALRRRLGLRRWHAAAFWAATIAVLFAPFTYFFLANGPPARCWAMASSGEPRQ